MILWYIACDVLCIIMKEWNGKWDCDSPTWQEVLDGMLAVTQYWRTKFHRTKHSRLVWLHLQSLKIIVNKLRKQPSKQ